MREGGKYSPTLGLTKYEYYDVNIFGPIVVETLSVNLDNG